MIRLPTTDEINGACDAYDDALPPGRVGAYADRAAMKAALVAFLRDRGDAPADTRERVGDALRRFHRDSCYPEPAPGEVQDAAREIIFLVAATLEPPE